MTDWIPGQSHWDQVLNKAIKQLQDAVDALSRQPAEATPINVNEGGMATPHTCAWCACYSERVPSCSGFCSLFDGQASAYDTRGRWEERSTPAPGPSEELRLLRRLEALLLQVGDADYWRAVVRGDKVPPHLTYGEAHSIGSTLVALSASEEQRCN